MHTFKRQTYSGQVVEFIKRCILDGELAPGEQVKEVILSERLGISRAPIREALGEVAPRIADFAEREGLHAHARSVTIRYE